ncbi:hypothetical protein DH2020_038194 [Rehmannia glutinosa]|uniref:Two-component response regulator-like protein n=1 Tax=Rehmannia glutinosa TaxID=99300 RepID=A0ABR0V233_REHGL
MWELGNLWADVRNTPMASYHTMMHEIHVLLVDHDSEGLLNTAKLLEICQYRVTLVELASAAISMLISGKVKFDVVMANVNSPDLHGFKLLQQAVSMGLPTVLMSSDDNTHMAMRALENGAFLYIKKPATMEMMRCLWQHVLREKTRIIRERDMLVAANNHGARGIEFRDVINHHREDQNPSNLESMIMMKNKGKSKKKVRGRNEDDDEEYDSENHRYTINNSSNVKRKMCTEWTHELHAKFMNAVEQLGEGRCFPKEILELMNVPGLTRMQVASHLQRKSHQAAQHTSSDPSGPGYKPRRFGSKPQLGKPRSGQAHESNGTGEQSETHSETEMPTNGNMGTGPTMTNTSHQHHQQHFGPMVQPGPSNGPPGANSSTNPRHSADEFFNFPDVDCLIQNLSGLPQGSGLNHPNPGPAAYHFDPNYHEQNSGGPSMDTKSNWSSETSNFESDHSETRGHD